jgi:tRNA modification GTPase
MSLQLDDTIAALASPPGPAASGIIRVSGARVRQVLASVFVPNAPNALASARAARSHSGHFRIPDLHRPVPVQLYDWPHDRSYTGQPMAELHTIGSSPLLDAMLLELHRHGARPARPGEFTLRAFLAGRIDLMQAEAILGVIDAHEHAELAQALNQLAGGISGPIASIREDLLLLLADLEAELDFVEEDIEFVSRERVIERLTRAQEYLNSIQAQAAGRMQSAARRRVVLAGLPNAGKSTLFNSLVGREAALVSEVQGTTRDYLSAELEWQGLPIKLVDTAGWHDADAAIDRQAQTLRNEQFEQADLIVWCTAIDCDADNRTIDVQLKSCLKEQGTTVLEATTKSDRAANRGAVDSLSVSAHSGHNLDALIDAVVAAFERPQTGERQMLGSTASRCRDSLEHAIGSLISARQAAECGEGQEIISIEIRAALDALGTILGTVYTDDILDRIFSRFCIGK